MADENKGFKPALNLLDATMVVAGSMIGSGIFIVSSEIARSVGSSGYFIAVWVLAGIVTLIAALSYGELSGMYPKAGGQYVYLREAYNKLMAFLFGWTFFAVIQTGGIAAVGVAFSKFTAYLIPQFGENVVLLNLGFTNITAAQLVAVVTIIILTFLNSRGVRNGKIIQTVFTLTKILSLVGLVVFGLWHFNSDVWHANWLHPWTMHSLKQVNGHTVVSALTGVAFIGALGVSMKGTIFSHDSWNNVTFIAGEIKNPSKNIGLSLFFGVLMVTIIYVLTNLTYLALLPMKAIAFAPNDRVATSAANQIFGNAGTIIIALMIMISTFGCNNGLILAGARVYHTMALDKVFFKKAARLNRFQVPGVALWMQCIWASFLCLTGQYSDLLAYVVFGVLVFYVLTIAGVFILRKKYPDAKRTYRVLGYPFTPIIYIIVASALAISLLLFEPYYSLPGLGIILLGIPIYYLILRKNLKNEGSESADKNADIS